MKESTGKTVQNTVQNEETKFRSVRGLNTKLFILARVSAIKNSQTVGQWLNQAIKDRLERE